ncbi:MAG: response regulator transcription factor [Patescibacteria group bacterium]|nr:response regulator transcription factor [Patescibacteria group bacterium]
MNLLIVEDEKEIIDFLRLSLEEEGFVVDTAEDGEIGSYKARTNKYDLILLDNNLPQKDGRQICFEIRSRGDEVPIIMLSVQSEIDSKVDLLNIGVDDYVTKPFSFEELLARIKALLRRPQKMEHRILKIDDLVLDTDSHSAQRGSKKVHLALKEFVLLEYLMRNQGQVLSRSTILEHVWDMNADPFTNTIETHILNLRRKIECNNKRKLIHTVSGVGYKIE